MDTLAYCLERCGGAGSAADHATAFLPLDRRGAVLALLALHEELRRASRPGPEAELAPARMGWWAGELERLCAGRPEHPVTRALQASLPADVYAATTSDWLEVHAGEGGRRRFADWQGLRDAATGVVQPLATALEATLGAPAENSHGWTGLLATCELVAGICRFRLDAERDRLNLPTGLLQSAGTTPARILEGDGGTALAEALQALAGHIRAHQRAVFQGLRSPRSLGPALVLSGLSIALLAELERGGFDVWHRRTALTPLRMAWLAWRIRRFPRRSPAAG